MKALYIPVTEKMELVDIDERAVLKSLQGYVGGLVEFVEIPTGDAVAWANEEGTVLSMGHNKRASQLAEQTIVGPVVITGEQNDEGDLTGVPEWIQQLVGGER